MKHLLVVLSMLLFATLASAQSLPPGVTLQAIDGERMLDTTTMTHNYFARNGYTYVSNPYTGAQGWDDPNFFPITIFYGLYADVITQFLALSASVSIAVTSDTDPAIFPNNHIWAIPGGGNPPEIGVNQATAGFHIDESDVGPHIASTPNATQDGRLWSTIQTWNQIYFGDIGGVPMSTYIRPTEGNQGHFTTPNGTKKGIGIYGVDWYWFAWANSGVNGGFNPVSAQVLGNYDSKAPAVTVDQAARGSHYGNMIDVMRSQSNEQNTGGRNDTYTTSGAPAKIPLYVCIENVGPGGLMGSTARQITAAQINWAVWSTLIHGARIVDYFTVAFGHNGGFGNTILPGETISGYDQAKATNALIKQLAPVLNSPFAVNYVTASPHGYNFPTPEGNWLNGGIETMAKYYNNEFYIFADTRASQSVTNISATFTIKNTNATSVTVVNESRTIPITNGGTTFTDVFASASTVHIYQVSGGSGIRPEIVPVKSALVVQFSNPVRNLADIRLGQENGLVSLYDPSGKIVRQLVVKSGRLMVSPSDITLNNGVYFLGVEGTAAMQRIMLVK
jgi:hypothetical protein